jgi:hypothetical protein
MRVILRRFNCFEAFIRDFLSTSLISLSEPADFYIDKFNNHGSRTEDKIYFHTICVAVFLPLIDLEAVVLTLLLSCNVDQSGSTIK